MAPTSQSTLHSHGVTAKTSPAKRQKNQKNNELRSATNAPPVTPAKEDIVVDNEEEPTSEAEGTKDSTMDDASPANATEENKEA